MTKKALDTKKIKEATSKLLKKMKGGYAEDNITDLIIKYGYIKKSLDKLEKDDNCNLERYIEMPTFTTNSEINDSNKDLQREKNKMYDICKSRMNSISSLEIAKKDCEKNIRIRFSKADFRIKEMDMRFSLNNNIPWNKTPVPLYENSNSPSVHRRKKYLYNDDYMRKIGVGDLVESGVLKNNNLKSKSFKYCDKFKSFEFCNDDNLNVVDMIKTNWDLNKITKLEYKKFKNSFQININDKIFTIYYYEDVLGGQSIIHNEMTCISEINSIKKSIRNTEKSHLKINLNKIKIDVKNRNNLKNIKNKYDKYSKVFDLLDLPYKEKYLELLDQLDEKIKLFKYADIIVSGLTFDAKNYFIKGQNNIIKKSIVNNQNLLYQNFTSKCIVLSDFIMKIEDYDTLLKIDTILQAMPNNGRKFDQHHIVENVLEYFKPQFNSILDLIITNNKNLCEKNMLQEYGEPKNPMLPKKYKGMKECDRKNYDKELKSNYDVFKYIYTNNNFIYNPQMIIDHVNMIYIPNEKDKDGNLPIHLAIEYKSNIDLIEFLLEKYPMSSRIKNNNGDLPIHLAIRKSADIDLIKSLLEKYPTSINIKDKDGQLPIHLACSTYDRSEREAIIELLLNNDTQKITLKIKNTMGLLPYEIYHKYFGKNKDINKKLRHGVTTFSKFKGLFS